MTGFRTTPAKDLIRERYDGQIVEDCCKRLGYKLSYFGLPGAEMLDVLCWKRFLDRITAIERDKDAQSNLLTTAFKNGVHSRLEILSGDIDEIMLKWKDSTGRVPQGPYDLINLDYEGGLMYKNLRNDSRRMTGIKEMVARQANSKKDCLMLLTVNSRNRDWGEFSAALQDILEQILEYSIDQAARDRASDVLQWYAAQRYDYKIKVYVPYVLEPLFADKRFVAHYYGPVTYLGTSNIRMVHFVIEMKYDETRASRAKSRSLPQIVDLPFYEVRKNAIVELWTEKITTV